MYIAINISFALLAIFFISE